jgi:hypothetical protein
LKILETIDWNTGSTRRELEKTGFLFRIPAPDTFPEVLDDFIILRVSAVVGVLLPVFDINVGDTTDKKLQLALVKHVDQVSRDELMEAGDEVLELLFNTLLNTPLSYEPIGLVDDQVRMQGVHTRRIPSCSRSLPRYPARLVSGQG